MTYPEAIQFLFSLRLFGTKLGLENTFQLAAQAGDPHKALRFVHVAGTNGKGSTCAMLESMYRQAGLRVGLFTSPHLVSFRERLQVNREWIPEADVVRLVTEAQRWFDGPAASVHATFFDLVTVMALHYFREQRCDLVIWETGLGGRLDSTNIVLPLASVITNIQLDHQKWLGSTLGQIAAEKAGIIKPGIPVLTATDEVEALDVIAAVAKRNGSPLTRVTREQMTLPPLDTVHLPLLGDHQRFNAALAVATVRALRGALPVSDEAIKVGLEGVRWPGRLQRFVTPDGRVILLDGAHNPAGADCVRSALERHFPENPPTFILGILQDKDYTAMCQALAPIAKRVLLAPVHSERTASPLELQRVCARLAPNCETLACGSLEEALAAAKADPFVVITGSLHFVGEAMELLELLPVSAGERGLNEWDAAARGRTATAVVP
ncbi:MAG: folylpolyglutamate synthase/dihydrofolate synthase family protein [Verrucomicrobiia bacterium]